MKNVEIAFCSGICCPPGRVTLARAKLHPERDGSYSIETIMPGHYPDRPAQHLHYFVSAPGHEVLITQAYFATDPFFEGNVDKN